MECYSKQININFIKEFCFAESKKGLSEAEEVSRKLYLKIQRIFFISDRNLFICLFC